MVFSRDQSELPDHHPDQLLTVADVAGQLNISPSLLYQMLDGGKLPFLRIGNGRGTIRFDRADVAEYLKSRRISKTPVSKSTLRLNLKHIQLKPR